MKNLPIKLFSLDSKIVRKYIKMPAYYSVFFTLEEFHPQRSLPLVSIYEALLIDEFKFGGEFGAEDYVNAENCHNTLESILAWNQTKIDNNCNKRSRGEDYRQFLLLNPFYDHCRVITALKYISVIVPEYAVTLSNFYNYRRFESLDLELIEPLKKLALNVWSTGLVTSIQTSAEAYGSYRLYQELLDDRLPYVCPFAILDQLCAQKLRQVNPPRKITEKKLSTGVLIESQEAIYGH